MRITHKKSCPLWEEGYKLEHVLNVSSCAIRTVMGYEMHFGDETDCELGIGTPS